MPLSVKWNICLSRDSNPLSRDPEALSRTKRVDETSTSGLYNENGQHIPSVVVVCSGLTSLSEFFSVISRRCLVATGSSMLTFIVLRQ